MEKWKEIYKGVIPPGDYVTKVKIGEEEGVVIILESNHNSIRIDFGALSAIRILDEGVVLQELFREEELTKYSKDKFINTIYKIKKGEFGEFVKKISGDTFYDYIKYEHYIIITLNYYIEVISQWEPEIEVNKII